MKNKKPMILSIKEVEDKIIDIINNSGLPAFYLLRIVRSIEKDLNPLEKEELKLASDSLKNNQIKR